MSFVPLRLYRIVLTCTRDQQLPQGSIEASVIKELYALQELNPAVESYIRRLHKLHSQGFRFAVVTKRGPIRWANVKTGADVAALCFTLSRCTRLSATSTGLRMFIIDNFDYLSSLSKLSKRMSAHS